MADDAPDFYEIFRQADSNYYFVIPQCDGPPGHNKHCGDILCGPYQNKARAEADCSDAKSRRRH